MNTRIEDGEAIVKGFTSCLNRLGLPVLRAKFDNATGTVLSQFSILNVPVDINIVYRSRNQIAEIDIELMLSFKNIDRGTLLQVINAMNGQLMDIGHLFVYLDDKAVTLKASNDFSNQDFDRQPKLTFMQRLFSQGSLCFHILVEIDQMNGCPFVVLRERIEELKRIPNNKHTTVH
jgi:hypothetical protein